jgi:hypothetical protein
MMDCRWVVQAIKILLSGAAQKVESLKGFAWDGVTEAYGLRCGMVLSDIWWASLFCSHTFASLA